MNTDGIAEMLEFQRRRRGIFAVRSSQIRKLRQERHIPVLFLRRRNKRLCEEVKMKMCLRPPSSWPSPPGEGTATASFSFCGRLSGKSSRRLCNEAVDVSPSPPTELGERAGVRWRVNCALLLDRNECRFRCSNMNRPTEENPMWTGPMGRFKVKTMKRDIQQFCGMLTG